MRTAVTVRHITVKGLLQAAPASRLYRLAAAFIDGAAFLALSAVLLLIGNAALVVLGGLSFMAYQVYFLSTSGQSLGKRAMDIRVITVRGERNGGFMTNVLKRVILNALLGLIPLYAIVDICFIFRRDRRCIHDLLAGTIVARCDNRFY